MSEIRPCGDQEQLGEAVEAAAEVVGGGECIVLPTDTVYGIGCDAFSAAGVQALLGAKGRTREMPPPVLIARPAVMEALADQVSQEARALAEAYWPGALTIVCWAQPTLGWDLGETHGTVALRVPDDRVTRAVLERVGPMAVSSANRTGMPAALTAQSAREMLQDRVPLYLDDGPRPVSGAADGARDVASTIVDCTGETPVVLRHGAITLERLREVVPAVHGGSHDNTAGTDGASEGALVTAPAAETATAATTATSATTSTAAEVPATTATTTATVTTTSPERRDARADAASSAGVDAAVPSDDDVVTAMVRDGSTAAEGAVDQGRDRLVHREPRWGGTSALSVEDAERLVGD